MVYKDLSKPFKICIAIYDRGKHSAIQVLIGKIAIFKGR